MFKYGVVPKWLKGPVCKTVIRRFESGRRLISCPGGGIGRHCRLKICCPNGRAGSSPALGTHRKKALTGPFFLSINHNSSIF